MTEVDDRKKDEMVDGGVAQVSEDVGARIAKAPEVVARPPEVAVDALDPEIDRIADVARDSVDGVSLAMMEKIFEYTDEKTGFRTTDIRACKLTGDDLAHSIYGYEGLPFLHPVTKCTVVQMKVINKRGEEVGKCKRKFLFDPNGNIYVEHDEDLMHQTSSGFGSRFQQVVEERYRILGVKAIVRGCGLKVGRYEGARNGFDFMKARQREEFIQAFCEFLEENGITEVAYKGKRVNVSGLAILIHAPQDILAVDGGREVPATLMDHEFVDGKWVPTNIEARSFPVGKAFFLDQASGAKKKLYDNGKWLGIKRLSL